MSGMTEPNLYTNRDRIRELLWPNVDTGNAKRKRESERRQIFVVVTVACEALTRGADADGDKDFHLHFKRCLKLKINFNHNKSPPCHDSISVCLSLSPSQFSVIERKHLISTYNTTAEANGNFTYFTSYCHEVLGKIKLSSWWCSSVARTSRLMFLQTTARIFYNMCHDMFTFHVYVLTFISPKLTTRERGTEVNMYGNHGVIG